MLVLRRPGHTTRWSTKIVCSVLLGEGETGDHSTVPADGGAPPRVLLQDNMPCEEANGAGPSQQWPLERGSQDLSSRLPATSYLLLIAST